MAVPDANTKAAAAEIMQSNFTLHLAIQY